MTEQEGHEDTLNATVDEAEDTKDANQASEGHIVKSDQVPDPPKDSDRHCQECGHVNYDWTKLTVVQCKCKDWNLRDHGYWSTKECNGNACIVL